MQKILVPTDFSNAALKAVTYAAEIAQKTGATIFLLHAVEIFIDMTIEPIVYDVKGQEELAKKELSRLDEIRNSVLEIYPSIVVETELAKGQIIDAILDFVEVQQINLIVMGTTGASGLKEIFMGSVSAGTISKTNIPVLTIPASYEIKEPNHILFATNHFEQKMELLNPIVAMARLYSATIYVAVFVDTDKAEAVDYLYNTRQLNDYIDFLNTTFSETTFKGELLEGSEFEETIEKYVLQNEVDIATLITYPKSFFEKLLRRSVTKKMAFHSTIPLLAIPAK
jgi:nucleotide-binding universal stress UspA family protein